MATFAAAVDFMRDRFGSLAGTMVRRMFLSLLVFGLFVAATAMLFSRVPTGFLPLEDKGALMANIQLPDGASLSRTEEVTGRASDNAARHRRRARCSGRSGIQPAVGRRAELRADHPDHGSVGRAHGIRQEVVQHLAQGE